MPLTVRLDPKSRRMLDALAKRSGTSRSDVVREAIARYAVDEVHADSRRPYDAWIDAIGAVKLGVRHRARTTGDQFTAMLEERARARRAR
jgi:predicted transcriptional regulator